MTAPSKIRAALADSNRLRRTRQMAEVMRHHAHGPDQSCTEDDLSAAGFSRAEMKAYGEGARALLKDLPPVVLAPSFAALEGKRLVKLARTVRRRIEARKAS